jgi:hypothetical protein
VKKIQEGVVLVAAAIASIDSGVTFCGFLLLFCLLDHYSAIGMDLAPVRTQS